MKEQNKRIMLLIPAILESVRSLKDRTWKIGFETNELTPEQSACINENLRQFGFLAFKRDKFKTDEIKILTDLKVDFEIEKKTSGQRLRAVLYRFWEQKNEGYKEFSKYYEWQMEKIIEHYKGKLN